MTLLQLVLTSMALVGVFVVSLLAIIPNVLDYPRRSVQS